jgi:DNA polymerase epsilon subunit 4
VPAATMPYNTAPISPRKEVTGHAQLPRKPGRANVKGPLINLRLVARVKKIISTDSDIAMCSNNAAFVITLATVCPSLDRCPVTIALI